MKYPEGQGISGGTGAVVGRTGVKRTIANIRLC